MSHGYYWELDLVQQRLYTIMKKEFLTIYEFMEKHNIAMRTVAYAHALNRHAEAVSAGGTQHYFNQHQF